ncbi:MAG: caspase family protein [Myxococcota bacterium]
MRVLRTCLVIALTGLLACSSGSLDRGARADEGLPGYLDDVAPARPPAPDRRDAAWDPTTTRAFIVSLAGFEGEAPGHTSFTTGDRNDGAFADLLRARGVPAANVVLLLDGDATSDAVRARFDAFLAASAPGETLLFYYGSHGGYDADTGVHTYSTFDGSIPVGWFVDRIDDAFRGDRALLFSDACYSGGLVEHAAGPHRVSYAALSSTGPHNLAHSGWRFLDVILRALGGRTEIDLDQDGTIVWRELATFAAHHMAFIADGKPNAIATGALSGDLVLARGVPAKADPRVGLHRDVVTADGSYPAEVLAARGDEVFVHPTAGVTHERDAWVPASQLRARAVPGYAAGDAVEVWYHGTGKWYPATVLGTFDHLTLAHYDGYADAWDEWFAPEVIRRRAP